MFRFENNGNFKDEAYIFAKQPSDLLIGTDQKGLITNFSIFFE